MSNTDVIIESTAKPLVNRIDIFVKEVTNQVEVFFKEHQTAVLVCLAVIIIICTLIYLSNRKNSNHSIETSNHNPVRKEKGV